MRSSTAARILGGACLPLILAACGGGSSDSPAPTPTPPGTVDRIEPYDPSAGKAAAATEPASVQPVAQSARTVALAPLAAPKSAPAALKSGQPLEIGQARDVAATASASATAALLQWHATAQGTQVAALRFVSPGAYGVRLGVWVQALPAGAVLRSYGAGGAATQISAAQLQAMAQRNAEGGASDAEAHTWWSPDFAAPETTLEIEIPAGTDPAAVRIAVPRLSHYTIDAAHWESAAATTTKAAGDAGACNRDAICTPEYLDQSRAVARMSFTRSNGKSYWCTGTLMNDARNSGTPHFLTANHCISTQSEASSLVTDWFYRASACGTPTTDPAARRLTGGATLLSANANTDVSFLRLNDAPPAGAVYAGSYFGTPAAAGTPLVAVHHPAGDRQKISLGTLSSYQNCPNGGDLCQTSAPADANFIRLSWQQGVVEQGSSGSAAFLTLQGKRYVVGQLFRGSSSCSNPQGTDDYGRFDVSYRSALSKWLNP